jgi:hypothetical protein
MSDTTIADIFRASTTTTEFREKLKTLRGNFPLGPDDIIALGDAYLDRFPGCDGNEDCDDVRDAYAVAKACIIEHIIAGTDQTVHGHLRCAFGGVPDIAPSLERIRSVTGPEALCRVLAGLEGNTERLHATVKALPPCIIKERFSGGLAYVVNAQYLMKMHAGIA